jgi:putative DNA methylase
MTTPYRKKLIEVALPLEAINVASAREKSIRQGHPSTLHLWWARRPLAAARAVLFAQLVDDPASWPEFFPNEEAQNQERQRLFRLIERLVVWENSNNEEVINAARLEIARSHARASSSLKAKSVLASGVTPKIVNDYLATELPPVHDPFAGGGTIPLEAQRLGLRAIATDLNPVAVLINKALIELPAQFANVRPINPASYSSGKLLTWEGCQGLADDVAYYGAWMRKEAERRVGHHYPTVRLPKDKGGGVATVVAWIWARTVKCPNPACGAASPLVRSFVLSTKLNAWLKPRVDRAARPPKVRFSIEYGGGPAPSANVGRSGAKCAACGEPIPLDHVRKEGCARRLGTQMLAIVAEGTKGRIYLEPTPAHIQAADVPMPPEVPDTELPPEALGFRVQGYGMTHHRDLFTTRQLTVLTTFSALVREAIELVRKDASAVLPNAAAADTYAKTVGLYLGFCASLAADDLSTIVTWRSGHGTGATRSTFARQAIPMTWDFAESNPFAGASGDIASTAKSAARVLAELPRNVQPGVVGQLDARKIDGSAIISTDPPYYDNIGYADLSDFFYVWLRSSLRLAWPEVLGTVLVPKREELIAAPHRFSGDKLQARAFFEEGLATSDLLTRQIRRVTDAVPDMLRGPARFPHRNWYRPARSIKKPAQFRERRRRKCHTFWSGPDQKTA